MSKQRIIIIVLALIGIAAAFLPWNSWDGKLDMMENGEPVAGISSPEEGNLNGIGVGLAEGVPVPAGLITLALFVVPLIFCALGQRYDSLEKSAFLTAICGLLAAGIGVWRIIDRDSVVIEKANMVFDGRVEIGIGLLVLCVAGLGVCIMSFVKMR